MRFFPLRSSQSCSASCCPAPVCPPSRPCPALLPILVCTVLLCLCQHRTGADAFLLSHRNLLVPFASSRSASARREGGQQGQLAADGRGVWRAPPSELFSLPAPSRGQRTHRRKRMHHLSILRKVGRPQEAGRLFGPQRQRELKRRTTAPLWLVEY